MRIKHAALALALALASSAAISAPGTMLFIVEDTAVLHLPAGGTIVVPAGTELVACEQAGVLMRYSLDALAILIPRPCSELFGNGFEGTDPPPRPRVNEGEEP